MTKAKVVFNRIVFDTQNYGCFDKNQDHMVSTLHFSLDVAEKHYDNLYVEVRQPYGTDFESEPLEVSEPQGSYRGPWNHDAFCTLCETCYRKAIGSKGSGIHTTGSTTVRMTNCLFTFRHTGEFDLPESGADSW